MKEERELIKLAKTERLDEIADQMQRPPETILKWAARLGLTIKGQRRNE